MRRAIQLCLALPVIWGCGQGMPRATQQAQPTTQAMPPRDFLPEWNVAARGRQDAASEAERILSMVGFTAFVRRFDGAFLQGWIQFDGSEPARQLLIPESDVALLVERGTNKAPGYITNLLVIAVGPEDVNSGLRPCHAALEIRWNPGDPGKDPDNGLAERLSYSYSGWVWNFNRYQFDNAMSADIESHPGEKSRLFELTLVPITDRAAGARESE